MGAPCGIGGWTPTSTWITIGTKKRVHHLVRACAFKLNGMPIVAHLNVLPLG